MNRSGLQDQLMGLTPEALSRFRKLEVIARMLHLIQFFLSLSINGTQILIRDPERQLFLQTGHQIASSAGRFPMMTGDLKEPSMDESTEGHSQPACCVKEEHLMTVSTSRCLSDG